MTFFLAKCNLNRNIFRETEYKFVDKLNNLFDIACANESKLIKFKKNRQFLLQQRLSGKSRSFGNIGMKILQKDDRFQKRKIVEEDRRSCVFSETESKL